MHFIFTEFSFDQNYKVISNSDDKLCLCVFPLSVFCFRTRAYKSKKNWNQNILSILCGLTANDVVLSISFIFLDGFIYMRLQCKVQQVTLPVLSIDTVSYMWYKGTPSQNPVTLGSTKATL